MTCLVVHLPFTPDCALEVAAVRTAKLLFLTDHAAESRGTTARTTSPVDHRLAAAS